MRKYNEFRPFGKSIATVKRQCKPFGCKTYCSGKRCDMLMEKSDSFDEVTTLMKNCQLNNVCQMKSKLLHLKAFCKLKIMETKQIIPIVIRYSDNYLTILSLNLLNTIVLQILLMHNCKYLSMCSSMFFLTNLFYHVVYL